MSFKEIVDLSSDDDEHEEVDVKPIKLELGFICNSRKPKGCHASQLKEDKKSNSQQTRQKSEENISSSTLSADQSSTSMLEQGQSPVDDTSLSPSTTIHPAPLCRQFWKAGSYKDDLGSKATRQNGKNYLHVHPMFLHSNATSHKWAFGAIAELLDNSIDEIQNGATFVIVDKTSNPRDGKEALLVQDDGGGMDVEAMRRCMSFGFSDKKAKSSIGRYGNGFKTSTMRLGADVIVFSRCLNDGVLSQSIGLLSYTFLSRTGHDRIVVPMVNYAFKTSTGTLEHQNSREHFTSNLSMLLKWSPFSTEAELLKQFNDVGPHGTKVIVFNLWLTNEGKVELDFDTDPEDIRIGGDSIKLANPIHEQHIANRLQFSLREYLSILYLRMPQNFSIKLRGRVVEHRIIANDLKYPEFILYKPQSGGCKEGEVITTIGFIKEAPQVNVHGFNVYHKNRLVLPFWQVVSYSDNRGRGVVGVLEANFIEPSHNKQDFERTSLFQKLENRLKEMTWEYWDYHCGLIGYLPKKKPRAPMITSHSTHFSGKELHVSLQNGSDYGTTKTASIGKRFQHTPVPNSHGISKQGLSGMKRKELDDSTEVQNQPKVNQEAANLLQKNKTLRAKCSEYEQKEKELNSKVTELRGEIAKFEKEYTRLLAAMLG